MIESTGLATQATNVMTSTSALSGGTKGEFDAALRPQHKAADAKLATAPDGDCGKASDS